MPGQQRRFSVFISHHKRDAALHARFLKDRLEPTVGGEIFLDSDQLGDLRLLLDAVKQSEVVLLVQSQGVLHRPYCLAELYTAVTNKIPYCP